MHDLSLAASDTSAEVTGVAAWAVSLMETIGPAGAAIAIAAENLFPPIPSDVILPLAGFTAARGGFSVFEAILWTTIGSVFGAYVLYFLGRLLGHERMVRIADKLPLVRSTDIQKTVDWFAKHGAKAVLFGRCLPIFRSLISIPAGIEKMPWLLFGLLTLVGSLVWNSVFVLAGYFLGAQWHIIGPWADTLQYFVIVAVVALVVWWVVKRIRENRRAGNSPLTS